jgi:asparagine synthetase B (glutamine-hydrolysing)
LAVDSVWDHRARRLTLARDYFATVSMFHHWGDGSIVVGTNPAALRALGLFSPSPPRYRLRYENRQPYLSRVRKSGTRFSEKLCAKTKN